MKVGGVERRSIWVGPGDGRVRILDQTRLPHEIEVVVLEDLDAASRAISEMQVRGAPLIGATAAHGLALGLENDPSDAGLAHACQRLLATRPTAVNLAWALERMRGVVAPLDPEARAARAREEAQRLCDEDVAACSAIGDHGLACLEARFGDRFARRETLHVLTHCNAGWLASVDWGTALAPIYKAHAAGHALHVWVDETRPRNQGASLTAFELREEEIEHTVIVDNAGGHLMQQGRVDLVLVGSDRTTSTGDVCNKIGTYLKALAAADNGVPFWVALPTSTIDWSIRDGLREIPIEERSGEEVRHVEGRSEAGELVRVALFDARTPVSNPAFDVTPSRFIDKLVTERGAVDASQEALTSLAPHPASAHQTP